MIHYVARADFIMHVLIFAVHTYYLHSIPSTLHCLLIQLPNLVSLEYYLGCM